MTSRYEWLLLAASLVIAAGACKDDPPLAANRCVSGWPSAGEFRPAPALDVAAPAILWRTRVTGAAVNDWLVVTDDRVAFTAGGSLYQLDRDGNYLHRRGSVGRERVSSVAVDADGNFYFVGYSVYSVDSAGEFRWIQPLPERSDSPGNYPRAQGRLVSDGRGGLYFGANDGFLYAAAMDTGEVRWRTEVTGAGERPPAPVGGVSHGLLAIAPDGDPNPQLWDTASGRPLAHFLGPTGDRYGAMFGRELGIVTQRMEDRGGAYPWMHISVLDECSRERWQVPATRPQWPVLIGPGEQLFVVERDDIEHSDTFVSIYQPDGARATGPVQMPPPWAIGADGTIYAVACDSSGYDGPSRLYAYSAALEPLWTLPLGEACPMAGPVIDADGRLYFSWYSESGTEVVAIQTASPGLADTSWPLRRGNNQGTGWLQDASGAVRE